MANVNDFLQSIKNQINEDKLFNKFDTALSMFDMDEISECIKKGIDIPKFEKYNGSSIIKLLIGASDSLCNYAKQFSKDYIEYYCSGWEKDLSELDPKYQVYIVDIQSKLINIMDYLHRHGASINAIDVIEDDFLNLFNFYTGKKVIEREKSPLEMIVLLTNVFKTDELVKWLVSQSDFDKQFKREIDILTCNDTDIATDVLACVLEAGAHVGEIDDIIPGFDYNPMINCLMNTKKTTKEKLKLLAKYAHPALVEKFKNQFGTYLKENVGSIDGEGLDL